VLQRAEMCGGALGSKRGFESASKDPYSGHRNRTTSSNDSYDYLRRNLQPV